MTRRVFISSVSAGYMFAVNATINAAKHFGTDAEFHLLYRPGEIPPDYMEAVSKESGVKVLWIESTPYGVSYNIPKYGYAASLADKCDAVCLIDADLFVCTNVNEHFENAEKGLFTTAGHMHAGGILDYLDFANPAAIGDRSKCQLADFPVFADPTKHEAFFKYWHTHVIQLGTEYDHPLIVMNRSVAMHFKKEQVICLDGHHWVADLRFWEMPYTYTAKDMMLFDLEGRVYACHNKWWKEGRAAAEIIASYQQRHPDYMAQFTESIKRGTDNFNTIVDLMKQYVALNPKIAWPCELKGPIEHRKIWEWWLSLPEGQAFAATRKDAYD